MNAIKNLLIISIFLIGLIFLSGTVYAGDSGTWYSKDKNTKVTWSSNYYQQSSEIRLYSGVITKYKKVSGHYKIVKKTGFGIKQSNYNGKRLKVRNQNFYIPYNGSAWYTYYFTYTSLSPIEYYKKIYRTKLLKNYGVISTPNPYNKLIDSVNKSYYWDSMAIKKLPIYWKAYRDKNGNIYIDAYSVYNGYKGRNYYYITKTSSENIRIIHITRIPDDDSFHSFPLNKKISITALQYYWKYLKPYLLKKGLYYPLDCYPYP